MPQGYNLHFSIKGGEFLHQFLANFSPKKFRFSIAFFRFILYNNLYNPSTGGHCAGVLELVDEVDSKSIASDGVRVRFPPPVPSPWMLASMGIPFLFDLLGASELPLRQGFAVQNAWDAPLGAKCFCYVDSTSFCVPFVGHRMKKPDRKTTSCPVFHISCGKATRIRSCPSS